MRIPFKLKCDSCSKEFYAFNHVLEYSLQSTCECGETKNASLGLGFTVGFKILLKSKYEFQELKDYSMTIVFAATAVDAEVSMLHNKWRNIRGLITGEFVSQKELQSLLEGYGNIFNKIQATAKLMYPKGFTKFVAGSNWKQTIDKGFPSLKLSNLISDIHKCLFRPRNAILHSADRMVNEKEALTAYNTADLSLRILHDLDQYKRAHTK